MLHSTLTKKGQTTIPGEVRKALNLQPGDRLEYRVEGDHAVVRAQPGTAALKGALASSKGKGLSFAEIRRIAAARASRNPAR